MAGYRLRQSGEEVQGILDNAAMRAQLTAETERAQQAEQQLQTNIDSEATARQQADGVLDGKITTEKNRAEGAEQALQTAINNEAQARQQADGVLDGKITTEKNRAEGAESALQTAIDNEAQARHQAVANEAEARASAVAGEASARQQADTMLQQHIDAEQSRAEGAEGVLDGKIAAEKTRAEGAEQALQTAINNEAQARKQTEGALDVSELNATENPHTLAKYVNLSAAIASIPTDYRKGGMSIKYVQSSDNKYVQYRLMSDTFSATPSDWQGVDDEPTDGSENLVKSGGVSKEVSQLKQGHSDNSVEIKGINNGVFISNNFTKGRYIDENGDVHTTGNTVALSSFIPIGIAYRIKISAGIIWGFVNKLDYAFYDENKDFISGGLYGGSSGSAATKTITEIPSGAEYIRFIACDLNEDFSSCKAEVFCFERFNDFDLEISKLSENQKTQLPKAAGLTRQITKDFSLFTYALSDYTMLIVDNKPIPPKSKYCTSVSFRNREIDTDFFFGFGYYQNDNFVVDTYTFIESLASSEVITKEVFLTLSSDKQLFPFFLCQKGRFRFAVAENPKYSYGTVQGESSFSSPIAVNTAGNGINFAAFEVIVQMDGYLDCQLSNNVLYVTNDGRFGYSTIQSAIDYAKTIQSALNPVTIFVGEGEFGRFDLDHGNYYISIIGCGREKTKVISTTGLYATPAANIETNGIIKGITFLSTHDDIESLNGDYGSYAVHHDFHTNVGQSRVTIYEDCDFISYQNSGFGCGIVGNETLILRNCGFFSYYTREFNPLEAIHRRYSSLLIHGAINEDSNSSKVVVENCKGFSLSCDVAVTMYDYYSLNNVFEVRNSQFYSEYGGISSFVEAANLSPLSYNNNIASLNYSYSQ